MKKQTNQMVLFEGLDKPMELEVERVGVYQRIADETSEATADKFAEVVAGVAAYIPARLKADHWITKTVGLEDGQKICDLLTMGITGVTMDFPVGEHGAQALRRKQIVALLNEGHSVNEIAATVGTGRNTVSRIRSKLRSQAKRMK